jgi:hypothetical protein
MAERPIFIPCTDGDNLVTEVSFDFAWNPGFAAVQKKKNVVALHAAAAVHGYSPLLEVSSKSSERLGQRLSAFSLKVNVDQLGEIPLECAFQGSKVFENGGPFTDLYLCEGRDAKRDPRIRSSGSIVEFRFNGITFPREPKTAFYDWLYICALFPHREFLKRLEHYAGFTDIEFNPTRSINCQARSCAMLVAMMKTQILERAIRSPEDFIATVGPTSSVQSLASQDKERASSLFEDRRPTVARDHYSDGLRNLADTIREVAESAGNNRAIPENDLRTLLLFMGKVCDVVEQAFRDVYAVLIQIRLLDSSAPHSANIRQLHGDLHLLLARDHYRDAEMVCGRLHALRDQFQHHVEPIVDKLQTGDRWRALFWLLDDREGRVITLVQSIVRELDQFIAGGTTADLDKAKKIARSRADEVRFVVLEMQNFNNGLLGMSGQEGWLELIGHDRGKLAAQVALVFQHDDHRTYEKNIVQADNNSGAIAVGHGNQATNNNSTKSGLSKAEVDELFTKAIAEVQKLKLPGGASNTAANQLEVAKDEAIKDEPDLEYVAKTLEKATATVKKAGVLVTATTALGKLLTPLAIWVGSVIA